MKIYYTKEHEWVKVEDSIGRIGITGYAAEQLGDITFVELPAMGKTIKQGRLLCELESVKAASEVFAPLSGKVIEVNGALEVSPEIVNTSPEDKGWISCLEISDLSEKENLMNQDQYSEYLATLK